MTAPRKRPGRTITTQGTPADPAGYLPRPPAPALSPAEQATVDRFEAGALDLTAEVADARLERIEQTLAVLAADRRTDTAGLIPAAAHPDELAALRRLKAALDAPGGPDEDLAERMVLDTFDALPADPAEWAGRARLLLRRLQSAVGNVSGPDLEAVVRLAERAAR